MTTLHVVASGDTQVAFNIPFRAEDTGDLLQAVFVADFDPDEISSNLFGPVDVPSSDLPLEEQLDRSISFNWDFAGDRRPDVGCHTFTMFLTYSDNFRNFYLPKDDSLAATETWWFYFAPESGGGGEFDVVECP